MSMTKSSWQQFVEKMVEFHYLIHHASIVLHLNAFFNGFHSK